MFYILLGFKRKWPYGPVRLANFDCFGKEVASHKDPYSRSEEDPYDPVQLSIAVWKIKPTGQFFIHFTPFSSK